MVIEGDRGALFLEPGGAPSGAVARANAKKRDSARRQKALMMAAGAVAGLAFVAMVAVSLYQLWRRD